MKRKNILTAVAAALTAGLGLTAAAILFVTLLVKPSRRFVVQDTPKDP